MELYNERVTMERKAPSLVDLCVKKAIDNLRYLGDVGETESHLLERILPHCTLDQLMHIENSTEDRDLGAVTDKLWKQFYTLKFRDKDPNELMEQMKKKKAVYKWKLLYQEELENIKRREKEIIARVKEIYKKECDRKQSRQVRLCTKVPPSSNKRSFYGSGPGSSIGYTKSNLMKKAKLDYLNSPEVKNAAVAKKNMVQRTQQRYSAPIMRTPQSSPMMRTLQSSPMMRTPQSAPMMRKPQSAPTDIMRKPQSAPIDIMRKPQSAPIMRKPQSAPIDKKPQSGPIIRKPQSAPIINKHQSASYPLKYSGASSSSSSSTSSPSPSPSPSPSRFAGDLLRQRRFF